MNHELTALYERLSHDDELQGEVNSYKAEQTQYEKDHKSATRFLKPARRYSNAGKYPLT